MVKTVLNVKGMSCEKCVKKIVDIVGVLPSVSSVFVDLSEKTVTVEHDFAKSPLECIKFEIEEIGYEVISGAVYYKPGYCLATFNFRT